jgi:hypothetical protein
LPGAGANASVVPGRPTERVADGGDLKAATVDEAVTQPRSVDMQKPTLAAGPRAARPGPGDLRGQEAGHVQRGPHRGGAPLLRAG